ncbi:hypothetical protein LLG96_04160 [bacterium]|nr:hypothetical protein [bacterium]
MKKLFFVALVALTLVPAVYAQDTIGIGWDNGYSIKFPAAPVCIQLTGKFDSIIPENDDLDTETDAEVAVYVMYPVMKYDKSNFNAFGGFGLIPTNKTTTVGLKSYDKELDFTVRLGIEPETMVTDHIGISAKAGLQIYMDQGYDGIDDSGSTDLGAWGSVGVHWYF